MTVHIEHATSDVVVEPEPPAAEDGGRESAAWADQHRVRALQHRLIRERLRTRAESFDD